MQKGRLTILLSLLLVASMVIAACAPRAGAGEIAEAADDSTVIIDLPAIVLEFDESGAANLGDVPVGKLAALAAPGALDQVQIPADQVQFMMESNIQHVQINNRVDGLDILINGEPIPSLEWDGESLVATTETLSTFGVAVPMLDRVLPLITNLGFAVVAKFPVAGGNEAIPLYVEGEGSSAAMMSSAVDEYLSTVGGVPAKIKLPVFYEQDGSWTVGDLTDTEWTAVTQGAVPWQELRLKPQAVEFLQGAGISQINISTDPEGITIALNDSPLPRIGWSNGELAHAIKLAQNFGALDGVGGMNADDLAATINDLLPMVQATDMEIVVHIPS